MAWFEQLFPVAQIWGSLRKRAESWTRGTGDMISEFSQFIAADQMAAAMDIPA